MKTNALLINLLWGGVNKVHVMELRKSRQIGALLICFCCALTAHAQDETLRIHGNIQDEFLERGLFDCVITLMRDSIKTEYEPKVYEIGSDSMHFITYYEFDIPNQPGHYTVRVQKEGYDDGVAGITVPEGFRGKLPQMTMVNMRRSYMKSFDLDEVEVSATRIKVLMRGDTLVYDASAFRMPEGSMLQNLIEQLPGARMNDAGEIFINGRKIDELTLNSRSLFRGNKQVLLENIPYFTVKELKVFERLSLNSVLAGRTDDKPEYVMDVRLKDEYSLGAIVNAEAAGGTHDRYQVRSFGMLLTKTLAIGAFGNINNTNDVTRAIRQGWHEGSGLILGNQNRPSTRKAAGMSIDYESQKRAWMGYPALMNYAQIAFDHYDNIIESGTYSARFLPVGTTYAQSFNSTKEEMTSVQVLEELFYLPYSINLNANITYYEKNNDANGSLQQSDSLRVTATQHTRALDKTRTYGLGWMDFSGWIPSLKSLSYKVSSRWERTEREAFNRQLSTTEPSATDYFRHEYADSRTTEYRLAPSVSFDQRIGKQFNMYLTEQYRISGNNSNDMLYVLSNLEGWGMQDSTAINLLPSNRELLNRVYDTDNSTYSRLRQQENEFTIALKRNKDKHFPIDATLRLPISTLHERLVYQRGEIDTLARHNMFALNPSLELRHEQWSLRMGMTSSTPGLMNLMP